MSETCCFSAKVEGRLAATVKDALNAVETSSHIHRDAEGRAWIDDTNTKVHLQLWRHEGGVLPGSCFAIAEHSNVLTDYWPATRVGHERRTYSSAPLGRVQTVCACHVQRGQIRGPASGIYYAASADCSGHGQGWLLYAAVLDPLRVVGLQDVREVKNGRQKPRRR